MTAVGQGLGQRLGQTLRLPAVLSAAQTRQPFQNVGRSEHLPAINTSRDPDALFEAGHEDFTRRQAVLSFTSILLIAKYSKIKTVIRRARGIVF